MKTILVIGLTLLLLLVGCIITVNYIENSARNIMGMVNSLDDAIDGQRWDEASQIYSRAYNTWQQVEKHWKIIINHDDMRDIQLGFVHLSVVLSQQDQKEAVKELASLRYYLSHVPDSERIELGNVL